MFRFQWADSGLCGNTPATMLAWGAHSRADYFQLQSEGIITKHIVSLLKSLQKVSAS